MKPKCGYHKHLNIFSMLAPSLVSWHRGKWRPVGEGLFLVGFRYLLIARQVLLKWGRGMKVTGPPYWQLDLWLAMALQLGGYGPPSEIPDLMPNNFHPCYPRAVPMLEFCGTSVRFPVFLKALCIYR